MHFCWQVWWQVFGHPVTFRIFRLCRRKPQHKNFQLLGGRGQKLLGHGTFFKVSIGWRGLIVPPYRYLSYIDIYSCQKTSEYIRKYSKTSQNIPKHPKTSKNIQKYPKMFATNPKKSRKTKSSSECIRMHRNASEWVRTGPNRSEQVQTHPKTAKNFQKLIKTFFFENKSQTKIQE